MEVNNILVENYMSQSEKIVSFRLLYSQNQCMLYDERRVEK